MALKENDFVINPKMPEWGTGKVLGSAGSNFRVFFENAGEKLMPLAGVEQIAADPEHPQLKYATRERDYSNYKSPGELIRSFLELFPEGFRDPEYLEDERDYKTSASEFMKEALSKHHLGDLLGAGNYDEVVRLAKQGISKTNLIFPNESMSFSDAFKVNEGNKKLFSEALHYLLYSDDPLQSRFVNFAGVLKGLGTAKWTLMTYFLHLVHPDKYPFLKPEITKNAADAFGFPLDYAPALEWETYHKLIELTKVVEEKISSNPLLIPADMIDIQGFMWCALPEKYGKEGRRQVIERRAERLAAGGESLVFV